MSRIAKVGNLNVLDFGPKGICFEWILSECKAIDNQEWTIVVGPKVSVDGFLGLIVKKLQL